MSKAKHKARERAVQALYMWRISGNDLSDIELHFLAEQDMKQVDKKYGNGEESSYFKWQVAQVQGVEEGTCYNC